MEKSILEVITGYAINEGLSPALQQDGEYRQIVQKINSLTEELDAFALSKEQRLTVDRLISAYNEDGAHYGRMTYQQGFRDCVALLLEIGLVKGGKREETA